MSERAAGMTLAGALFLGFVVCLALVSASAASLGVTSWVAVTAVGGALFVVGTVLLWTAAQSLRPRPAVCPINQELWRIIEEDTGQHRR